MPLDPFFAQRLRTHRRYLVGKALGDLKRKLPWASLPARAKMKTDAGAPASPAASPAKTAPQPAPSGPREARARHRRAALGWDRTEQRTVGTPGPDLRTTEHMVTVPGYPAVRVRIYHPDTSGPVPACLTFYGGAFRIGGIDYPTTDAAHRRRAAASGVALLAVDYALAPEHRYPTQVEQAYAALEWLFDNAQDLGINRDRIGIAGISAGGNLAAAV